MKSNIHLLIALSALFPMTTQAESLSLFSGVKYGQHGYFSDAANLNSTVIGANLDLTQFRTKQDGWLARGFSLEYQNGYQYSKVNTQLPIYHWHKHQGLWLKIQLQTQNMEIELSSDETLLSNSGVSTSLSAGSLLAAQQTINQYEVYWYESTKDQGPINLLGVYYYSESSPASSEINGSSASIFDGAFNGYGFTLGRIKDTKGFNFQWRLNVAELDMSFSNDATQHRTASSEESSAYQLGLTLNWHYRHYLAPYWYLVPKVKLRINTLFQTQMDPVELNYDPLIYLEAASWISIQRRF